MDYILNVVCADIFIILRIKYYQTCNTYMKHKRPCVTTFTKTEERVENTIWSGVFLTNIFKWVLKLI